MGEFFKKKYSALKRKDFFDFYGYAQSMIAKIKTRCLYGLIFGKIGKDVWIKKPSQIYGAGRIYFEDGVRLERGAILYVVKYYGKTAYTGRIVIGENTFANRDLNLTAAFDMIIGEKVVFGPNVFVTDFDHGYEDLKNSRLETELISKGPVAIGNRCWIGANTFIGSGVTLGEGCVVAANSVVTKSFPPFSVIAGVPAKIIKKYDSSENQWVRVKN